MAKKRFFDFRSQNFLDRNQHDALYGSWFIQRLIGGLPLKSRSKNRSLFWAVLKDFSVDGLTQHRVIPLILLCLHATRPVVWIRIERRGRRERRIPVRLKPMAQYRKSIRWLIRSFQLNNKQGIGLKKSLFIELKSILEGDSLSYLWIKQVNKDVNRCKHNYKAPKKLVNRFF